MALSRAAKRVVFPVVILAVSVCACLVLAELGLAWHEYPPIPVSGWTSEQSYPSRGAELNQLRYRGQRIAYSDDELVVVLLGDSQAEAVSCAFEAMPEKRLQVHLRKLTRRNIRVFTLASGGYGQDQEWLALQRYYQQYRADLVVLWETHFNDVWNNVFPTNWPKDGTPKPTFWLEDGVLRGPTEGLGQPVARFRLEMLLKQSLHYSRDEAWDRFLPPAYEPLQNPPTSYSTVWETALAPEENLENEKSHYAVLLTPRSPRLQYGLDLTRRLLFEIRDSVVAHKGRLVCFQTGNGGTPFRTFKTPEGEFFRVKGKFYRASLTQYFDNIRYVNKDLEFVYIPIERTDWAVSPTDPHLNASAVDDVMKYLADWLSSHLP